jgi:hypothetical protein
MLSGQRPTLVTDRAMEAWYTWQATRTTKILSDARRRGNSVAARRAGATKRDAGRRVSQSSVKNSEGIE